MKYLRNVVTLELDSEKCKGCKECLNVCPHAVFKYENKKAVIDKKDQCMECGACMKNCEFGAISVRAGVGCASGIINGILTGGDACCDPNKPCC
jgi:NAD-dependent dihydropyrimidine dehydrogenase PreA subunit